MILSSDKTCRVLPHYQNILDIYNEAPPVVKQLAAYKPLIAGGYPMALVFAPRLKSLNCVSTKYYTDYDMYFSSSDDLNSAILHLEELRNSGKAANYHNTDNAITYSIKSDDKSYSIQLVKKTLGSPEEVLSSFDFKNCAIGFAPHSSTVFFHKEAPSLHISQKLDVLNPWMINPVSSLDKSSVSNIIIQLLRFKKYCDRWDYTLSRDSFDLLLQVYNTFPSLSVTKHKAYYASGGPYHAIPFKSATSYNVWTIMAKLITSNTRWSSDLDKHGIFISGYQNGD